MSAYNPEPVPANPKAPPATGTEPAAIAEMSRPSPIISAVSAAVQCPDSKGLCDFL